MKLHEIEKRIAELAEHPLIKEWLDLQERRVCGIYEEALETQIWTYEPDPNKPPPIVRFET